MLPSNQNPPCLVYTILLLHFFLITGVGGVNFTIVNRCAQPIWAMAVDNQTPRVSRTSASGGDEVPTGSSIAIQIPKDWRGRVWGKTGCVFNDSGGASCATGDDAPWTLAEFGLQQFQSLDFYDVSLVDGYNLPLLINPSGGCEPTGCIEDLNGMCPPELSTASGAACNGPCAVFRTPEYCCTEASCGPTAYSRLFKNVCPKAYSYPQDDATSIFNCTAAADYHITFCPPYNSSLAMTPAPTPTNNNPPPRKEPISPAPTPTNNNPPPRKEPISPAPTPAYNNLQQRKGKNRAKEIVTIVSLSISGIIVVFITICCFLKRRQRHSQNDHERKCNRDVENILLQHGSLAPKRYRYSEIKKITKSFSDKLGRGGYGSVYKGMLPDGRLVAVKILVETDSNGEEFVNEVTSISRTYHLNIVSLLGFCYEGNKRALVYEFMPNKSLDKFLTNSGSADCFLDLNKIYNIAVGIAKGLEYLHTGCITRIVHFDIKPQNILLDEEFCPKISDFGLAKLCKKQQSVLSVVGTRGTAGYIAPEVFSRNFGGVSHKSDVYSYGMMLLEMAGARKATPAEAIQSCEDYFPDKFYEEVIVDVSNNLNELTMEEDEERRKKMFMVGFWCIQTIPSDRPSISKVVEMLEGNLEAIQIPPKPFLFTSVIPDLQTSSSLSEHVETQKIAQD